MSEQRNVQVDLSQSCAKGVEDDVDDLEKDCVNDDDDDDDEDDEDDNTSQMHQLHEVECKTTTLIDQRVKLSTNEQQKQLHQQNGHLHHVSEHNLIAQLEEQFQTCLDLRSHNDHLTKRVARLSQRLRWAVDTAQTHGQRLLRAAYQEKVRELNAEHTLKTTEMLNLQKRCFEEELEAMGAEHQAALSQLHNELETERALRIAGEARYARERDLALEKTTTTMLAVQRKVSALNARIGKLEREKKTLSNAVTEKQMMIELLANKAAVKDVERRRLEVLGRVREEESIRKEEIVERLEQEVAILRDELAHERTNRLNLIMRLDEVEDQKVIEGTVGSDVSGKSDLENKESSS